MRTATPIWAGGDPDRGLRPDRHDWEGFAPVPEEFLDAGDTVVVLGRYRGTYKATGRTLDAQFVHVWRVEDGKAVAFQQYTDTLQAVRVTERRGG